jgi:CrcB protein
VRQEDRSTQPADSAQQVGDRPPDDAVLPVDPDLDVDTPAPSAPSRPPGWLRRRGPVYAVIALGGFLGGQARYGIGLLWPEHPGAFPWTTFGINVSGAFLLALLLVLILEAWNAPAWVRPFAATGVLGAFTNFSSIAFALDRLAAGRHWGVFVAYAAFSVLAGLASASFGLLSGRAFITARVRHSGSRAEAVGQ